MRSKLLLLTLLTLACLQFASAQEFQIVHFDVGQGDGALIWSPSGQTMLVDAGSAIEPDIIQPWLQSHGITHINYTVATHYHADHIGEFVDMFTSGWLPDSAYDRGSNPGYTTATYTNYVNAAGSHRRTLAAGQTINLGAGVTVKAICVNGYLMSGQQYTMSDENERSICLLVEYRNFRYVIAGDLGGGGLGLIDLETPCALLIGNVNGVKLNHHGSNSSTNSNWFNNLQPETAVVSLADNNSYGFVHTEVIGRVNGFANLQHLYHTQEGVNVSPKSIIVNDDIIIETDGFTSYTMDGDVYDIGPDVFLTVWVDPSTVQPIPQTGGWLYWNLLVSNTELNPLPCAVKFWLEVPGSPPITLINRPNYSLPVLPGGATRSPQYYLQSNAPAGMYQLIGEVRNLPGTVLYAADRDTFYKAGVQDQFSLPYITDYVPESDFLGDLDRTCNLAVPVMLPSSVTLNAFPNPFNSTTHFTVSFPSNQLAKFEIFDLAGRKIADIFNGTLTAGSHTFTWGAGDNPAGLYFARLTTGSITQTQKLIYMK